MQADVEDLPSCELALMHHKGERAPSTGEPSKSNVAGVQLGPVEFYSGFRFRHLVGSHGCRLAGIAPICYTLYVMLRAEALISLCCNNFLQLSSSCCILDHPSLCSLVKLPLC